MERPESKTEAGLRGRHAGGVTPGALDLDDDAGKRKRNVAIGAIIAVIVAVLLGIGACSALGGDDDGWYDTAAEYGSFEGKTQEEIIADLNKIVEEGMMNISCNSIIRFPNGDRTGIAHIENIAANHMDQKVTITLADTDEVVYESDAIPPGYSINEIEINRDLDPGTYDAIVSFQGYEKETHLKKGGALAVEAQLIVLEPQ